MFHVSFRVDVVIDDCIDIDCCVLCFFFQAEDGIRDAQESRGLGDVYKRQVTLQGQCKIFRR